MLEGAASSIAVGPGRISSSMPRYSGYMNNNSALGLQSRWDRNGDRLQSGVPGFELVLALGRPPAWGDFGCADTEDRAML